jgi:hypothetical protein
MVRMVTERETPQRDLRHAGVAVALRLAWRPSVRFHVVCELVLFSPKVVCCYCGHELVELTGVGPSALGTEPSLGEATAGVQPRARAMK